MCSCASGELAAINTVTSGSIYYQVCAGSPTFTVGTSTSTKPIATPTKPPAAKPSEALIIYREDSCDDTTCSSGGYVYDITPGGPLPDVCSNPPNDFRFNYKESVANDNSNYSIDVGTFTTHGIKNCEYSGYSLTVGKLSCPLELPGGPMQCSVPTAQATSCSSANSLDADDWTPIVLCQW